MGYNSEDGGTGGRRRMRCLSDGREGFWIMAGKRAKKGMNRKSREMHRDDCNRFHKSVIIRMDD